VLRVDDNMSSSYPNERNDRPRSLAAKNRPDGPTFKAGSSQDDLVGGQIEKIRRNHRPRQDLVRTARPIQANSPTTTWVRSTATEAKGLWAGTWSGLDRFDLYRGSFEHHNGTIPRTPKSMSDNQVQTILEDRDNKLWVGTDNGLNRLVSADGRYESYLHEPELCRKFEPIAWILALSSKSATAAPLGRHRQMGLNHWPRGERH